MAWFYLIVAGIFEMIGVAMISLYHNKRNISSLLLLIVGFGASFLFLSLAMQTLSMSLAYAIWTGIGASGAAILGMAWFKEAIEWKRILFIIIIIGSTIGLKLVS
jgi:paired small multidrug resistance pump